MSDDAHNVSVEQAKEVAVNFVNQNDLIEKPSSLKKGSKTIDNVVIVPDLENEPALYVVRFQGAGYAVISATTKESPVIGFSDEEVFDAETVPSGMADWFFERMYKIQSVRNNEEYEIPEEVNAEWAKVLRPLILTRNHLPLL
ncbi:Spi family protease inhibitor [Cytophagaceae bacterium ABcell3]|nr:Spi family protease inhibitor [Cytophagaceae bacterium ABcell3]